MEQSSEISTDQALVEFKAYTLWRLKKDADIDVFATGNLGAVLLLRVLEMIDLAKREDKP